MQPVKEPVKHGPSGCTQVTMAESGRAGAAPPYCWAVDGLDFARLGAVVLDMDGTLWRGDLALPGLAPWFAFLGERALPYLLATNNAYWPPAHYVAKLAGFGATVPPERILTSGIATAAWLRGELPAGSSVYVVGGDALRAALAAAGFAIRTDDGNPVAAVVAGIDFELTYAKIRAAARLIRGGARFIGTNPDKTYPDADGLAPGAGTVLAAIAAASGVEPTVVGKPGRAMFDAAVAYLGLPPDRVLMVGDRLETDIAGGRAAGLATALVLTGVDGPADVAATGIHPDAVFADLDALRAAWAEPSAWRAPPAV
jgi:4-nitrophenyl phosphatase